MVKFRQRLAIVLTVIFATILPAASQDTPSGRDSQGGGAVARKFKRVSFPKDRFSILLPGDYFTAEKGSDIRTYTCTDYPHGLLSVMCALAPEQSAFSQQVLKQLVDKLTPNKKSIDKESPIKIQDNDGTEWQITNNGDAPQAGCLVRGLIVGRRLYIIMAYGTKPWLESDAIKGFMDSFEVSR